MTVQYFPVLDPKKSVFFHIGWLSANALYHCFTTIKAVDRKNDPNEKWNVELNKILDQTIWNIYGIVFKRLKSHASFIRCRIKRLLDVLLYNTGYIWTRTQLEKSYWTRLTARPIWLFKLCTRPNIFPYCTVKRLITYNYYGKTKRKDGQNQEITSEWN